MPRPPQDRVRLVRVADASGLPRGVRDPAFWAGWLGDGWEGGEKLSEKPGASVRVLATDAGRTMPEFAMPELVVKVEPIGSLRRTLQSLTHTTPLERHWRGADALHQAGIRTARPVALLRGMTRDTPPRRVECLVMERAPGATLLAHLAGAPRGDPHTLSRDERARVARAVARMVFRLHARGLVNRDPKPSNLIVLDPRGASPEIAVVDCVGVRRARPWERLGSARDHRLARTLASLVIEPIGTGCPPARTDRMRVLSELARLLRAEGFAAPRSRDLWRSVEALVRAHADPRPAHDPLAASRLPGSGGGTARPPTD
ncbi:MAG: lipopolysaccharide kinase InaA family protein [Phycisphaerales bacterium]|jgi:hypothetical protein|nr:lipopolysaccharide kinase InaA family protein [Phycisphaerales bacterium]